jgi:ubiquinone/menaquinone biosynthesis C-methylase UbiE
MSIKFSRVLNFSPSEWLNSIETDPPQVTYDGPPAIRDSRQLMSEISKELPRGGCVLDLGCGPRDQAVPVTYSRYQYVGIDYSNEQADFLADAHAIPFKDNVFDCVLSYAVLEHLHNPFVAIREIERVLKPGGIYVGTVSQGEPFHSSFFHHTAWGFLSLVSSVSTLQVKRLWSSGDTLRSLSRMGGYPKAIKELLKMVDWVHRKLPWLAPRKMKWSHKRKKLDALYRAGSVCFVVKKSGDTGASGRQRNAAE